MKIASLGNLGKQKSKVDLFLNVTFFIFVCVCFVTFGPVPKSTPKTGLGTETQ